MPTALGPSAIPATPVVFARLISAPFQTRQISVGSLVMVITVVIALEQRMFTLGQNLTQAVSSYGQISEGLAELLQPHEITDRPGATPLRVTGAQIRFDALDFCYRNKCVFEGDFHLTPDRGDGSRPHRRRWQPRSTDRARRRLRQPVEQPGVRVYS